MKKISFLILLLLLTITVFSQKQHEKYYQKRFAEYIHGKTEIVLDDRTRADIVTDTFAIEVDFAHKWAESIGQSLHYADMLHKKAGVLLIVNEKKDNKYIDTLMSVAIKQNITVWLIFINDNTWEKVNIVKEKDSTVRFIY